MKRKAAALFLSLAMLATACVPGTLATSIDAQTVESEFQVDVSNPVEPTKSAANVDVKETLGSNEATTLAETDSAAETTAPAEIDSAEKATAPAEIDSAAETTAPAEIDSAEKATVPAKIDSAEKATAPAKTDSAEKTTAAGSECTCGSKDGIHAESCPLYEAASEAPPVAERKITDGVVTVFGYIPEDVKLVVENYSAIGMFSLPNSVQTPLAKLVKNYSDMGTSPLSNDAPSPLARLNVTLYNPDGSEWQPEEGRSVSVTLDAAALGLEDGHGYIVSHIHEDEVNGETTTNFASTPSNGKMTFELTGFSYVLVFDGTQTFTLPNIDVFYTTSTIVTSTNGHLQFLGIYYDTEGYTHFLIGTVQAPNSSTLSQIKSVAVDGVTFNKNDVKLTAYITPFSTVKFKAEDNDEILQTVTMNGGKVAAGFVDFNIGKVTLGEDFSFAVNGDGNGQGWQIGGKTTINLQYDLIKKVAKGTSATADFTDSVTVERGDWVIYKITVNNIGTMPLSGMKVTDMLPADAFVPGSIMMGIGDAAGNVANWEAFNSVLFENYNSPGQFSRDLYISAQVKPNLDINTLTEYVNTAKMEGMNMPEKEDRATISVKPPELGTLTVRKAVTSENPLDQPNADAEFNFTVKDAEGNTYNFTLKNGESYSIPKFPLGDYTVTETITEGYTTTVNGKETNVYKGTMSERAAPVVAFENKFSARSTSLSITKIVNKAYENDVLPADDVFSFKVSITGEGVPSGYTYTKADEAPGTVMNDGIITLKANQTAVIHGIPVGAAYTVTEVLGDLSNDYEFVSVSGGTTASGPGTGGVLAIEGAEITFTNSYKKHLADLTITKSGAKDIDENQSFVFHIIGDGTDMKVVIHGNSSVTIKDLPCGTYTVKEETEWSWRYTPSEGEKTILLTADGATADFENDRTAINWLNGCAWCDNRWIDASTKKGGSDNVPN